MSTRVEQPLIMQDILPQDIRVKNKKRLIVCCDGTGQSSNNGLNQIPTNVTRLARALDTSEIIAEGVEIPQVVLYQAGVATEEPTWAGKTLSGAFGYGVDRHILEAYTFLSLNYEEGDELFFFGFSRGAFTARATASLICNAGLLTKDCLEKIPIIYAEYRHRRDTTESRMAFEVWIKNRAKDDHGNVEIEDTKVDENEKFTLNKSVVISIMGLFDTVGSLGIPEGNFASKGLSYIGLNNEKYKYHDTSFPVRFHSDNDTFRPHIDTAWQMLSLDECRASFSPTLLYTQESEVCDTRFHQIWMPGVHCDVGGGYERAYRDLSDLSFATIYDLCARKLAFRRGITTEIKLSSLLPQRAGGLPPNGWGLSPIHDEYHTMTWKFGGQVYRTPKQYFLHKESKYETSESVHPAVRLRMLKTGWRPPALNEFQLVCDGRGNYCWKKNVPGHEPIEIPEWPFKSGGVPTAESSDTEELMEIVLLDKQAIDLLNGEEENENLMGSGVVGEKSGWMKWLGWS